MRYIEEKPFLTRKGETFKINEDGKETLATVGEVLKLVANNYRPNPQQLVLDMGQLRRLNKVLDVLDGKPLQHGDKKYWPLEDEDYSLVNTLVGKIATIFIPYNAPMLEDIVKAALEKLPEPEKTEKPEKVSRK